PHAVVRSEPALLDEQRKSRADEFAVVAPALNLNLQFTPFGGYERLVEETGIIAGIEYDLGAERPERPVVRHLGFANEITAANLDPIDRKPPRARVHQPLAHEWCFKSARGTIGAARRLVGEPHVANGPIDRYTIRPRQHRRREIGHRRRVSAHITALIVEELVIDGEDAALGVDRGAHLVLLLARMIVLDPFHRPAEA